MKNVQSDILCSTINSDIVDSQKIVVSKTKNLKDVSCCFSELLKHLTLTGSGGKMTDHQLELSSQQQEL